MQKMSRVLVEHTRSRLDQPSGDDPNLPPSPRGLSNRECPLLATVMRRLPSTRSSERIENTYFLGHANFKQNHKELTTCHHPLADPEDHQGLHPLTLGMT
jgi:hypothetical protein